MKSADSLWPTFSANLRFMTFAKINGLNVIYQAYSLFSEGITKHHFGCPISTFGFAIISEVEIILFDQFRIL